MAARLVLFAREPVAGTVKTRLARGIGDDGAVSLYASFLADLARSLPSPGEWEAVLAYAGDGLGPRLAGRFAGWRAVPQGEGGLGDRMARAAAGALREGGPVVIVGSDAPELSAGDVRRAFETLSAGADVVFSPAPDGGFSLVGLRAGVPPEVLFGRSRWSTPDALADTRAAAEAAGCRVALLPPVADVDVAEDLDALAARLAARPDACPATRQALREVAR